MPREKGDPAIGGLNEFSSALIGGQLDILQERAAKNFPGTAYAIFYNHASRKLEYAPPNLILSSSFSHAIDYGSGLFEGISAHVNERTGIPHIILLNERTDRMFNRSIPTSALTSPISPDQFKEAVTDFVAVNGQNNELFRNPKKPGELARAYIRPSMHPASLGGYGVWLAKGYPVDVTFLTWPWPDFFDPSIYTDGGEVAVTGAQRLSPVLGKHAYNYGRAVVDGQQARSEFGAREFVYLAPYLIDDEGLRFWADPKDFEQKIRHGNLADGSGEEVFAITRDMKTMVFPPMDVNRLGGTVLKYGKDHIAPRFGLEVREGNITLRGLREKEFSALAFAGNAAKIAPLRLVKIFNSQPGPNYGKLEEEIELFKPGDIPEPLRLIMHRWEDEINGRVDPSDPSLITPVDMEKGRRIREELDNTFATKKVLSLAE